MNLIVAAGILIAICGIYLSLREHGENQQVDAAEDDKGTNTRNYRSALFISLAFVGLAILGLAHASTGVSDDTSPVVSDMRATVFFFGAALTLAGALGAVLVRDRQNVVISLAVFGTGATTVLGVSGNILVGSLTLTGAAACGWWLHRQKDQQYSDSFSEETVNPPDSTVSSKLDIEQSTVAEPLLTSVAVVLFCWILGVVVHSTTVDERAGNSAMSGSTRALPRIPYNVDLPQSATARPGSLNSKQHAESETGSMRAGWLFWSAAGLLAVTVGLGYSRPDDSLDYHTTSDND